MTNAATTTEKLVTRTDPSDRYRICWMDENENNHSMELDMTLESLSRFVNFLEDHRARYITVTDSNDELVDDI